MAFVNWANWPSWLKHSVEERGVLLQPLGWPINCFQFSERRALVPEEEGILLLSLQKQLQDTWLGRGVWVSTFVIKHTHTLFFKTHKNFIVAPSVGQAKSSILNKFLSLQDSYSVQEIFLYHCSTMNPYHGVLGLSLTVTLQENVLWCSFISLEGTC